MLQGDMFFLSNFITSDVQLVFIILRCIILFFSIFMSLFIPLFPIGSEIISKHFSRPKIID